MNAPVPTPRPRPASRARPRPDQGRPSASSALAALGMAQLLFAHGRRGEAARYLAKARAIGRRFHSPFQDYLCHLLGAQFALATGKSRWAHSLLRRGLALGRRNGFAGLPYWTPEMACRILGEALRAGIEVDHVRALIRARDLTLDAPAPDLETWPWAVRVYALGDFAVQVEDRPLGVAPPGAHAALSLLQGLVAAGERGVAETRLAAQLWPGRDVEGSARALEAGLAELRALLGGCPVVIREGGRLRLDARRCWVDAWAFDRVLDEAGDAAKRGRATQARGQRTRALAWYRGPLVGPAGDAQGVTAARERLHGRFLQAAVAHCAQLEAAGELDELLEQTQQLLGVDETAEPLYRFLIRGLVAAGQPRHAARVYERCRQALVARLGAEPSDETRLLHALIQGDPDTAPLPDWPVPATGRGPVVPLSRPH